LIDATVHDEAAGCPAAFSLKGNAMRHLSVIMAVLLAPAPGAAQSGATHAVEVLDLQLAMRAALRAIEVCNEAGYQAGASVVDRFGVEQVTLRSNMGGAYVGEAARHKAWAAASFNLPTQELEGRPEGGGGANGADMTHHGVGLPIVSRSGDLLGGIGVAGGGGSKNEAQCAKAGLDAIAQQLK
jgi:uncharacterized protein GlcG (DUF336 family)